MLGIGTGIMNAAGAGAGGGGGGSFAPTDLTLIAAYEPFDRTAVFESYRNLVNNATTARPQLKTTAASSNGTNIGTIVDKASLPGWDGSQTFQEWLDATTPDLDEDFSATGSWTLGSGWAITGGELVATAAASAASIDIGIEDSTFYYVEIDFGTWTNNNINWSLGGNTATVNQPGSSGVTQQCMMWSGTGGDGTFAVTGVTATGAITGLRVWKAPGHHVFATANDRGNLQTVNGVSVVRTGNGDWFVSDKGVAVAGTNVSGLMMVDPNDTASMSSYGGMTGIGDNGSGGDSILFGNRTPSGSFHPNILIDDGTNTEVLYTRGTANTALQIAEWNVNGGTSYEVWEDNGSVASGTPTYTVDMTTQSADCRISIGTTPGASDTFDAWGDHYAIYWYEGDRSADLFTHVNTNTGEQL